MSVQEATACLAVYRPVCSTENVTFGNSCEARGAEIQCEVSLDIKISLKEEAVIGYSLLLPGPVSLPAKLSAGRIFPLPACLCHHGTDFLQQVSGGHCWGLGPL